MEVTYPITFDYVKALSGQLMRPKILEIGDWNMDITMLVSVNHGLGTRWKNVYGWEVLIRDDTDSFLYPGARQDGAGAGTYPACGVTIIQVTTLSLGRVTGGFFDNANFDLTPFNRGWVMLWVAD